MVRCIRLLDAPASAFMPSVGLSQRKASLNVHV